jgi:hypothetical protein
MKVVSISDIHGHLEVKIPKADVLVIGGDIVPPSMTFGGHDIDAQADWILKEFKDWCNKQPVKDIIVVAGNHDEVFQHGKNKIWGIGVNPHDCDDTPWHYLQDSSIIIDHVKFYGTPWQPWFHSWAFNLPQGDDGSAVFDMIPADTDVLITHSPPRGKGDQVGDRECGSHSLLDNVYRVKPKLHVYGHIHWSAGFREEIKHEDGSSTYLANVSLVDPSYEIKYKPLVKEI